VEQTLLEWRERDILARGTTQRGQAARTETRMLRCTRKRRGGPCMQPWVRVGTRVRRQGDGRVQMERGEMDGDTSEKRKKRRRWL
jgi:hypothetical protein